MDSNKPKKKIPLPAVFLIDFAVFLAAMPVFALFHHVIPFSYAGLFQQPAEIAITDWSSSFPGVFTEEGVAEIGKNYYRCDSFSVTVTEGEAFGSTYHLADVYLRDITQLKTAFAGGAYSRGYADSVVNMAKETGAVFAVSGDYYGIRERGVVVRNGVVYRKTKAHQIGALYADGEFVTYPYAEFQVDNAIRRGVWQIWDFGPELLRDGKAVTEFKTGIAGANPRMVIGYFEPGHYCFIAVDGRQDGSPGLTLPELAVLTERLGCRTAYNLDGGHSAVMVLNGRIVNSPSKAGGRDISDIIYLSQADPDEKETAP